MTKYSLEFILSTGDASLEDLKGCLLEWGDNLEIFPMPQNDTDRGKHFKIQMSTVDSTVIFDTCAQFGRIKTVKVIEVT